MFGEIRFEAAAQFSTGEHDAPPAAFAFQPDVRAKTGDRPLIGAARVLFTKLKMVVEFQVGEHGKVIG
jgi:hypothetical protein